MDFYSEIRKTDQKQHLSKPCHGVFCMIWDFEMEGIGHPQVCGMEQGETN